MTHLVESTLTNLPNTLACKSHVMTDIVECSLLTANAKALGDDGLLLVAKNRAHQLYQVGTHGVVVDLPVSGKIGRRGQHVGHHRVFTIFDGSIDAGNMWLCEDGLFYLVNLY